PTPERDPVARLDDQVKVIVLDADVHYAKSVAARGRACRRPDREIPRSRSQIRHIARHPQCHVHRIARAMEWPSRVRYTRSPVLRWPPCANAPTSPGARCRQSESLLLHARNIVTNLELAIIQIRQSELSRAADRAASRRTLSRSVATCR